MLNVNVINAQWDNDMMYFHLQTVYMYTKINYTKLYMIRRLNIKHILNIFYQHQFGGSNIYICLYVLYVTYIETVHQQQY